MYFSNFEIIFLSTLIKIGTVNDNQKLGLICALLEVGDWLSVLPLLDRFPEYHAVASSRRCADAIINILWRTIDSFFMKTCSKLSCFLSLPTSKQRAHQDPNGAASELYIHSVKQVSRINRTVLYRFYEIVNLMKVLISELFQVDSWEDLFDAAIPILSYLGPHIGCSPALFSRFVKLFVAFCEERNRTESGDTRTKMDESIVLKPYDFNYYLLNNYVFSVSEPC